MKCKVAYQIKIRSVSDTKDFIINFHLLNNNKDLLFRCVFRNVLINQDKVDMVVKYLHIYQPCEVIYLRD